MTQYATSLQSLWAKRNAAQPATLSSQALRDRYVSGLCLPHLKDIRQPGFTRPVCLWSLPSTSEERHPSARLHMTDMSLVSAFHTRGTTSVSQASQDRYVSGLCLPHLKKDIHQPGSTGPVCLWSLPSTPEEGHPSTRLYRTGCLWSLPSGLKEGHSSAGASQANLHLC